MSMTLEILPQESPPPRSLLAYITFSPARLTTILKQGPCFFHTQTLPPRPLLTPVYRNSSYHGQKTGLILSLKAWLNLNACWPRSRSWNLVTWQNSVKLCPRPSSLSIQSSSPVSSPPPPSSRLGLSSTCYILPFPWAPGHEVPSVYLTPLPGYLKRNL